MLCCKQRSLALSCNQISSQKVFKFEFFVIDRKQKAGIEVYRNYELERGTTLAFDLSININTIDYERHSLLLYTILLVTTIPFTQK